MCIVVFVPNYEYCGIINMLSEDANRCYTKRDINQRDGHTIMNEIAMHAHIPTISFIQTWNFIHHWDYLCSYAYQRISIYNTDMYKLNFYNVMNIILCSPCISDCIS